MVARLNRYQLLRALPLMALSFALWGCSTTTHSARAASLGVDNVSDTTSAQAPAGAKTLYALARLLVDKDDVEGAAVVLESIINEHKEFLPAYTDLAVILADRGKLDTAEQVLKKGLTVAGSDPLLHNDLGVIKVLQADYGAALQCFERAGALSPGDSRYRANQALATALLGDYDKALAMYQGIVSPEDALHNVNVIRTMMVARMHNPSAGTEQLHNLIGLKPSQPDAGAAPQEALATPGPVASSEPRLPPEDVGTGEEPAALPVTHKEPAPVEASQAPAPVPALESAEAVEVPAALPMTQVEPEPVQSSEAAAPVPAPEPLKAVELTAAPKPHNEAEHVKASETPAPPPAPEPATVAAEESTPPAASVQPMQTVVEVSPAVSPSPPSEAASVSSQETSAPMVESAPGGNRGYLMRRSTPATVSEQPREVVSRVSTKPSAEVSAAEPGNSVPAAKPEPKRAEVKDTTLPDPVTVARRQEKHVSRAQLEPVSDSADSPEREPIQSDTPREGAKPQVQGPQIVEAQDVLPGSTAKWTIQVGSFVRASLAEAERFKEHVEQETGYKTVLNTTEDQRFVRVWVGTFPDFYSALDTRRALGKTDEFKNSFIRKIGE